MASEPRKPSPKISEEPRISRGRTRPEAIFPVAPLSSALPETYVATHQEIKTHLRNARIRAILAANPIVIEAYWHTGKIILARQQEAAWGAKVIDRLAADLQEAFPDMGGLSSRNLLAMKIFAREFPSGPIAQQPVAQLPWGHVLPKKARARRRVCPARLGPIHRRRRLADPTHRIPPGRTARQSAHHRGNRSRARWRPSSRIAKTRRIS
jgi:predicted nuclease of restriction endonuclease-like (RecB) superfamily